MVPVLLGPDPPAPPVAVVENPPPSAITKAPKLDCPPAVAAAPPFIPPLPPAPTVTATWLPGVTVRTLLA
jgi:hypothetical protein